GVQTCALPICLSHRIGAVHGTFNLIGSFCQVNGDFLTAYRHSGGNGDINLFDTVVLEVVRECARSIGKAAYRCAGSALAVGHECVTGAGEFLSSPFRDELEHATLSKTVGCDLRHEVSADLICGANIHQTQCEALALNLTVRK